MASAGTTSVEVVHEGEQLSVVGQGTLCIAIICFSVIGCMLVFFCLYNLVLFSLSFDDKNTS